MRISDWSSDVCSSDLGSELNFFEWNDPNCDAFRVACRTRTRRKKQEHARQSGGECPAQSAVCSVGFHITLPVYWLGASGLPDRCRRKALLRRYSLPLFPIRSEEGRVGKGGVCTCR